MKTTTTIEADVIELCGLRAMIGKVVEITVAPLKKKRSNPQNKYRWSVVVPMVRAELLSQGIALTSKQVNEVLKKVTGFYHITVDLNGQQADVFEETGRYGTAQFELWMEAVRAWGAEFLQIQIPLPNEHEYDNWVNEQIKKETSKCQN